VQRGDVLARAGGGPAATQRLDAALDLHDARHGEPVHVHHGTREAPGRLVDLGHGLWQLRLERPLFAAAGDRVIVRATSPPDTLGGGVVLDPAPRRHGRRPDVVTGLERLRRGEPEPEPDVRVAAIAAEPAARPEDLAAALSRPRSRSRSGCAPPGTSRPPRTSSAARRPSCARCTPPDAPCASGARCTHTRTRSRR
jgi:selenocysteine-specific translation elongation factor